MDEGSVREVLKTLPKFYGGVDLPLPMNRLQRVVEAVAISTIAYRVFNIADQEEVSNYVEHLINTLASLLDFVYSGDKSTKEFEGIDNVSNKVEAANQYILNHPESTPLDIPLQSLFAMTIHPFLAFLFTRMPLDYSDAAMNSRISLQLYSVSRMFQVDLDIIADMLSECIDIYLKKMKFLSQVKESFGIDIIEGLYKEASDACNSTKH